MRASSAEAISRYSAAATRWTTTVSSKVNLPPFNRLDGRMWYVFGHAAIKKLMQRNPRSPLRGQGGSTQDTATLTRPTLEPWAGSRGARPGSGCRGSMRSRSERLISAQGSVGQRLQQQPRRLSRRRKEIPQAAKSCTQHENQKRAPKSMPLDPRDWKGVLKRGRGGGREGGRERARGYRVRPRAADAG